MTDQKKWLAALGDAVRCERQFIGISQRDLADDSGTNRNTILAIEQGKTNAGIATLRSVADALCIPLPDLISAADRRHQR